MSAVLGDRYVLAPHDPHDDSLTGHDRLLDRDVDVVLLDPVLNAPERAAFVRALRRSSGISMPAVCPVLDVGVDGNRPYLVVPRAAGRLDALLQHPVPAAVQARVARDIVAGVLALEDRQLRPRSLRPSQLRLDAAGGVQIVPTATVPSLRERLTAPNATGPVARAAVREEVRQFLRYLLSAGVGSPPAAVVAFARESAGPPLRDLRPATDSWLETEGSAPTAMPDLVVPPPDEAPAMASRSVTERALTNPSVADPSMADPSLGDPSVTDPSLVDPLPVDLPLTDPPVADSPATDRPMINPLGTDRPVPGRSVTGTPSPVTAPATADVEPVDLDDLRTRRIVAHVTAGFGLILFLGVTVLALMTLLRPI